QRLQPELAHPLRLALEGGDLLDDLLGQTSLRLEDGVGRVFPVEAVALAQLFEVFFLGNSHLIPHGVGTVQSSRGRSESHPPGRIRPSYRARTPIPTSPRLDV